MIFTLLLNMIFAVVYTITLPLRLFSDTTLPAWASGLSAQIAPALTPLGAFLPLTALFAVLSFFITFEAAILLWHIINWLIRRIPTQS